MSNKPSEIISIANRERTQALVDGTRAERPCDMERGQTFRVFKYDDGDIQIAIEDAECRTKLAVFREPVRGGGQSPRTHAALLELMKAMQQDAEERAARERGWL